MKHPIRIRPAYRSVDDVNEFTGFALHQWNEHSNQYQPVTAAMSYDRLMKELDSVGILSMEVMRKRSWVHGIQVSA